jgi:hypothetical protein
LTRNGSNPVSSNREARAHHQSGHAVAAVSFRLHFTSVWLDEDARDHDLLGHARGQRTRRLGREAAQRQPEIYLRRAIVALAGPEAEYDFLLGLPNPPDQDARREAWRDRDDATWTGEDMSRARTLLSWIHNPLSDREALAYLAATRHRTRVMVGAWRPVIGKVAEALLASGRLEEDEVKALCWRGVAG